MNTESLVQEFNNFADNFFLQRKAFREAFEAVKTSLGDDFPRSISPFGGSPAADRIVYVVARRYTDGDYYALADYLRGICCLMMKNK